MVEKDLELGEYEVTWTLSGYDTLKAHIRVEGTGVTCISVDAGGACDSATPPGVTISTFTVTGYLKPTAAPAEKMTKAEFLAELQNRGKIDLSKVSPRTSYDVWYYFMRGDELGYMHPRGYAIAVTNISVRNPPTRVSDIYFRDRGYNVDEIDRSWALARINELPFVSGPQKGYLKVDTSPTGATVMVDIAFPCGTTPVTKCELDTGTKTVKITKSGYDTVIKTVTIVAGQTSDLGTIILTPTTAPPTSFDDWVESKGGKNAITGGDINELTDAYLGLENIGFSVTGADVNKATDYYLGLG